MDSVHGDCCVKSECQTEEPKQQAEPHTGALFQETANADGDKERPDKHDHGDRVSFCFGKCFEHQGRSISESSSLKSFLVERRQTMAVRTGARLPIWNGNPESV